MYFKRTLLKIIIFSVLCLCTNASVEVETDLGRIVGIEKAFISRGKEYMVNNFLGIPYAKPPIGELRFERPVAVNKSDLREPFMATKYSPACAQVKVQSMQGYDYQSEDCLYLNIYVPAQASDEDSGHAVMVFIHGGGFENGAGETYEGERLAVLGNVIVVTFNYRLGIFGLFSSGDDHIPGNMGLFDQHMAFKWVNKHIAAFGGDPKRVTVFGQSAGGSSVFFQGLYPANEGLIHRLIPQSGIPTLGIAMNTDPKPQFDFIIREFGCESESIEQSIKCLKEKDSETVIKTMEIMIEKSAENPETFMFVHFVLTADGEFIKKNCLPANVGRQSRSEILPQVEYFRTLDLMTGYNSDDGAFVLTVPEFVPITDADSFLPSREEFSGNLMAAPLGFYFGGEFPSVINSLVVSQYTDWSNPDNAINTRNKYSELWNDIYFGKGTNEYTIMHANSTGTGSTYLYVFSAPTSLHLVKVPKWCEGASHGDELPFIFNFAEKLLKDTNESLTIEAVQDWEWDLSYRMIQIWANFAKTGNPNKPFEYTPIWPQYDMTEQTAMDIGKNMSEQSVMRKFYIEKNNFWMETIPTVIEAVQQGQNQTSRSNYTQGTCDAEKTCKDFVCSSCRRNTPWQAYVYLFAVIWTVLKDFNAVTWQRP